MDRKAAVHAHIQAIALELAGFIKDREPFYSDRWVPAAEIKGSLPLEFVAVPSGGKQYRETGWLYAIVARILGDQGRIEYCKKGSRAYCRMKE